MTDNQIKTLFSGYEDTLEARHNDLQKLEAEIKEINIQMMNLEVKWLETHSCSCELVGLQCYHGEETNPEDEEIGEDSGTGNEIS